MALRDWSVGRILSIWTGWMAGLLVLLLGAVVLSPTGTLSLTISPAGLPLGSRIALAVIGLVAACLPPAALTYAWYSARLRAWSEEKQPVDREVEPRLRTDVERARQLAAPISDDAPARAQRVPVHRRDDDA